MANQTVIRAYAQAALETALAPWTKSLRAIATRIEKSGKSAELDNSTTPFAQKQELVNGLLPADTSPEIRNYILTMASRNEVSLLPEVLLSFDQMITGQFHRELASVTSAVELSPSEKGQLEERLHRQYGANLDFEYQVDPGILGGLVVRVGDRVIDGSVAGKLAALRQNLEGTR